MKDILSLAQPRGGRHGLRRSSPLSSLCDTAFAWSSTAFSSTLPPAVRSSGLASSILLWLIPPLQRRTQEAWVSGTMVNEEIALASAAMNSGRERVERRLAAILAADVAGYSRLMGADEEGTHAALTALRRDVSTPRSPSIAVASSRRPATGCWSSFRASSMRCVARSRCSAR